MTRRGATCVREHDMGNGSTGIKEYGSNPVTYIEDQLPEQGAQSNTDSEVLAGSLLATACVQKSVHGAHRDTVGCPNREPEILCTACCTFSIHFLWPGDKVECESGGRTVTDPEQLEGPGTSMRA